MGRWPQCTRGSRRSRYAPPQSTELGAGGTQFGLFSIVTSTRASYNHKNGLKKFNKHFWSISGNFEPLWLFSLFFYQFFFWRNKLKWYSVQSQVPVQAVDASEASLEEKEWQCKLSTNQHSGKMLSTNSDTGRNQGGGGQNSSIGVDTISLHTKFQSPTMPWTGQKVCVRLWGIRRCKNLVYQL